MTAAPHLEQTARLARTEKRKRFRHELYVITLALAAVAIILLLAAHGYRYYLSGSAERALSAQYAELRPSGTLGRPLGIAGGALLLLIFLYPLRKRWKWLSRRGSTKRWLDYHIVMGLTAPALLAFHASFKFRGAAGAAYWSMVAVVASGIVGRYLYSKIPRRLGEAEMTLEEMEKTSAELAAQIQAQRALPEKYLRRLLALPSAEKVRHMALPTALVLIVALDARRTLLRWLLLLRAPAAISRNAELRQALALASRQATISKDILFLSRLRRLFHLWHVIHRPFSYSLAILAALHIAVVTFFGY